MSQSPKGGAGSADEFGLGARAGAPDPEVLPGGFDLTDNRPAFDWPSKWPRKARREIALEAVYVFGLFAFVPIALLLVWTGHAREWLGDISDASYRSFQRYSYGTLGGLLGGVLFDFKWLYHTAAKGRWHQDRRLWRLVSPLISAGLAPSVLALASSGLLPLIDANQLRAGSAIFGVTFVIGYFSDNTVAALARLAEKLFGGPTRVKPTPRDAELVEGEGSDAESTVE